jgi:hypothetical protein
MSDPVQVEATGNASAVSIRLVAMDKPFFIALAVTLAIGAGVMAFWAEREARLAEYYAIDLEMKMAQAGMHPPPDPWRKDTGEKK